MDTTLHQKLRDRVNSSAFLCPQYCNIDDRNRWNCICSAMDWIDVGMSSIDDALTEFRQANALQKSMKFFYYVVCIDVVWEAIKQLHRVFINRRTIPFQDTHRWFANNQFNQDDNTYFKTIRACFGAHSVNLQDIPGHKQMFASWSYSFNSKDSISIILYTNMPDQKDVHLSVDIAQLHNFFKERYEYIQKIIETIDAIDDNYYDTFRQTPIKACDDPVEQISVLMEENKKRLESEDIELRLKEIKSFLQVRFICPENKAKLERFREQLIQGITEIKNALQSVNTDLLQISNVLSPRNRPRENMWGYEFASLYETVFVGHHKLFFPERIIEPLKDYLVFEYTSYEELYWLVVIALNLAQDDLKIEPVNTFDIDELLSIINEHEA